MPWYINCPLLVKHLSFELCFLPKKMIEIQDCLWKILDEFASQLEICKSYLSYIQFLYIVSIFDNCFVISAKYLFFFIRFINFSDVVVEDKTNTNKIWKTKQVLFLWKKFNL